MPVVRLPDKLVTELNQSQSGTIDNTEGPGVASYWASDRSVRVDIYIGLKLDGFKRYRNISAVKRSIKMQFVPQPIVSCESDDVESFDPYEDKAIRIEVSRHVPALLRCSSQTFSTTVISSYNRGKSAKNTVGFSQEWEYIHP